MFTQDVQNPTLFRYPEQVQILNPSQTPLMARARAALMSMGFDSHYARSVDSPRDGLLTIRGHGNTRTFEVEERRTLKPRLGFTAATFKAGPMTAAALMRHQKFTQAYGQLVVTEYVDEATAAALWAEGVNFLDAAGNANIDLIGLRIEVSGQRLVTAPQEDRLENRVRQAPEAGAFSSAGLPVSLLLMSRPDLVASDPTIREIENLVPSSLGKVQDVVSGLRAAGLLTTGKGGRVIQGRRWLNAWTEGYLRYRHKWHSDVRFSPPGGGTLSMLHKMVADRDDAWLGGEAAASRMGLPLRSTTTLIYAAEAQPVIRALKLRKDPAGQVELAQPLWLRDGWDNPLAPSVVIRADLLASGDPRQVEMAEEVAQHDENLRLLLRGK